VYALQGVKGAMSDGTDAAPASASASVPTAEPQEMAAPARTQVLAPARTQVRTLEQRYAAEAQALATRTAKILAEFAAARVTLGEKIRYAGMCVKGRTVVRAGPSATIPLGSKAEVFQRGIGLKALVRLLRSLTNDELHVWSNFGGTGRFKWPLRIPGTEVLGGLKRLREEFYNDTEAMLEALTAEGTRNKNVGRHVAWLDAFFYDVVTFVQHKEFPILDFGDSGTCGRCGGVGYRCKFCGSCWCEDDVEHRNHYLRCGGGYKHIRRTRTSYGCNTF
jgi:hypothetical protein